MLEVVYLPLDGLVARVVEDAGLEPRRIPFTRALCIARRTATGTATIPPADRADCLPAVLAQLGRRHTAARMIGKSSETFEIIDLDLDL
ncbi:hypothetical protein [Streptomyces sp. NPDC057460]|uniref:hypothetical protein n=1 Tax=Streptomyces sp. NPDC057460 TaxID=3346141 RepID=UPI00367BE18F